MHKKFLLLFSATGAVFMTYLVYLHYAPNPSSFCELGSHFSCVTVNKSLYSKIFGVPVAIPGVFYFVLMFFYALHSTGKDAYQKIALITTLILVPSLYLTLVSAFILDKYCLFCEGSKMLMIAILGTSIHASCPKTFVKKLTIALIFGLIFAGVAYYYHSIVASLI